MLGLVEASPAPRLPYPEEALAMVLDNGDVICLRCGKDIQVEIEFETENRRVWWDDGVWEYDVEASDSYIKQFFCPGGCFRGVPDLTFGQTKGGTDTDASTERSN